jgi:hypothetical protein
MRGQLAALGYIVEKIGESQRILPHAIRQKFTIRADGELEPFTEGSSRSVTVVVTDAGLAVVERYDLHTPSSRFPGTKAIRFRFRLFVRGSVLLKSR